MSISQSPSGESAPDRLLRELAELKSYKETEIRDLMRKALILSANSKGSVPERKGFHAQSISVNEGYEFFARPAGTGEDKKEVKEGKKDEKKGLEEASEEMVLSHFDFEKIDPERNCLFEGRERLIPVSLREMAEKRRHAAVEIASMLHNMPAGEIKEEHLRNLRKLRFSRQLQALHVLLDISWYLEGETKSAHQDIEIVTANALVLKKALEEKIIAFSGSDPKLLELRPGNKIYCYYRKRIAGSEYQTKITGLELPSLRDDPLDF